MLKDRKIAILGCGTMGRTLARGLLREGALPVSSLCGTIAHAARCDEVAQETGIRIGIDNAAAARGADVLLACVKPKGIVPLLEGLAHEGALAHAPLVLSIAAGVSTRAMEEAAGGTLRVVRAMPNTPCRIGEGMTVVSAGSHAGEPELAIAEAVMRPLGRVLRLDEEHMDAVTGLSASGPAFVYVIIEALAEGGVMVGLPRRVATELAAQTVQGAARMVLETGRHPASLKDDVTTPAGCTISALLALEDGKLRSVLARGVQEAARSAAGLGKAAPK